MVIQITGERCSTMQEMHEINGRDIGMDSVAKSNSLIGNNEVDDFAKKPKRLNETCWIGS